MYYGLRSGELLSDAPSYRELLNRIGPTDLPPMPGDLEVLPWLGQEPLRPATASVASPVRTTVTDTGAAWTNSPWVWIAGGGVALLLLLRR